MSSVIDNFLATQFFKKKNNIGLIVYSIVTSCFISSGVIYSISLLFLP